MTPRCIILIDAMIKSCCQGRTITIFFFFFFFIIIDALFDRMPMMIRIRGGPKQKIIDNLNAHIIHLVNHFQIPNGLFPILLRQRRHDLRPTTARQPNVLQCLPCMYQLTWIEQRVLPAARLTALHRRNEDVGTNGECQGVVRQYFARTHARPCGVVHGFHGRQFVYVRLGMAHHEQREEGLEPNECCQIALIPATMDAIQPHFILTGVVARSSIEYVVM
mmetsp:Transcript_20576/g.31463  ORF Transcript_20576/g.31463 Transcript_20576/m.31463 type:complete len:220 (+) Transcript_20576:1574-2233(+)